MAKRGRKNQPTSLEAETVSALKSYRGRDYTTEFNRNRSYSIFDLKNANPQIMAAIVVHKMKTKESAFSDEELVGLYEDRKTHV